MPNRRRRVTASMRAMRSEGVVIRPRETIMVVAPAGGCPRRKNTISPEVRPSDRPAARAWRRLTPASRAPGASRMPKMASEATALMTPIKWPVRVFRGDAADAVGRWKMRNAVGPSEGKMSGASAK